jgi:hypothetical protein
VISLEQEDGATVAHGAALDDYLGASTRVAVDAEARARYQRWRARRARGLTVDEVELTRVWEVELMAQCFLPASRLLHGLPVALDAIGASCLVLRGLDAATIPLVHAIASLADVGIRRESETDRMHDRVGRRPLPPARAVGGMGIPPRVRGEIVCMPYWPLYPAIASMARGRNRLRPVAARVLLPSLGRRGALSVAAAGGWMGVPGRGLRAASRTAVRAAIDAAHEGCGEDRIDTVIDLLALDTLRRLAGDTLAWVWHARRGLAGSRVRLGLVPFDSAGDARMLLCALRGADIPSLMLQHGFPARQGEPEMTTADHVAIWSGHERSLAPNRDPATVTVTGNPGAAHLAHPGRRRTATGRRSVILVDYPGRLTARIDSRVGMRHIAAALRALAAARPGTHAVLRPHPSDLRVAGYQWLAAQRRELSIEIDAHTPIESLLASADLCIGALSTATLQACALGVPAVVLDVAGIERPWPFDGSAMPVSAGSDCLRDSIATALASRDVAGRAAAFDALGVRSDAVERVVDLVAATAR